MGPVGVILQHIFRLSLGNNVTKTLSLCHATRGHLSRRTNGTTEPESDSPGEYKLASSLAPAWCWPHLTVVRPGPCGSGFVASAPQPFSSSILAISPLWARPLQPHRSQPARNQRTHRLLSPQSPQRPLANQVRAGEGADQSAAAKVLRRRRGDQSGWREERPHLSTPPVASTAWAAFFGARQGALWSRHPPIHDLEHVIRVVTQQLGKHQV